MTISSVENSLRFINIDGVVRGDEKVAYGRILRWIDIDLENVFDDQGNLCAGDEELRQISEAICKVYDYPESSWGEQMSVVDRRALERKKIILESLYDEIMESRSPLIKFLRQCFRSVPSSQFHARSLKETFENVSALLNDPTHLFEALRFTKGFSLGANSNLDYFSPYLFNPELDGLVLMILSQVFKTAESLSAFARTFARDCIFNQRPQVAGRLFIYFADQPEMVYEILQNLQSEGVISFPLACRLIEASGTSEAEVSRAKALVKKLEKMNTRSDPSDEIVDAEEGLEDGIFDSRSYEVESEEERYVDLLRGGELRDYVFPGDEVSSIIYKKGLYLEECDIYRSRGSCLRDMARMIAKAKEPYDINWEYVPPPPYAP